MVARSRSDGNTTRGGIGMKIATNACRRLLQRLLKILGLGAAGAGIVTVATGGQVFASLFLKDTTSVANPDMVYDPNLQLMVRPGTEEPIFLYSKKLLRGKENGEYRVAPLVNKTSPPPPPPPPQTRRSPPPPPPLPRVTPGPQGPHAD
jgi:hypothetical protein